MAVSSSYAAKGNKYKFQVAEVILFEYFITLMERDGGLYLCCLLLFPIINEYFGKKKGS